jgi:putative tryptophan/tyrosine transport system substrate-binding protein
MRHRFAVLWRWITGQGTTDDRLIQARERRATNTMPKNIGIIHSGKSGNHDAEIKAFQAGVQSVGLTLNTDFKILNVRYANDDPDNLDQQAKDSVTTDKPDLLVAGGGTRSALAASKFANQVSAIVFTSVADPTSFAQYQNMTGICASTSGHDSDRLRWLQQLMPAVKQIGVLVNLDRTNLTTQMGDLDGEATALGLPALYYQKIDPKSADVEADINQAFQNCVGNNCEAVLVAADPLFNNHRPKIVEFANTQNANIPTIYQWREFADAGGLISYGPRLTLAYTLAGMYAGKILQGTKPQQLTVLTLKSFELVINLTTANALINATKLNAIPSNVLENANDIVM